MSVDDAREFISHHGTKGMKWGVRRKSTSSGSSPSKTTYTKNPARLSEAELKRRIGRMELEKKYSDLNLGAKSPGKKYVNSLLDNQSKAVIGTVIGTTVSFLVQRALKKKFAG